MSNGHANISSPTIKAIIDGLYQFKSKADAQSFLDDLKLKFSISSKHALAKNDVCLWVKGYAISAPEQKGSFANITVINENGWKLRATKIEVDVKFHPQRVYVKQQHPNWGHPILRNIKAKKTYLAIDDASAELINLQKDFPKIAIPAPNKLYIMIYEKSKTGGDVKKYVLEIKPAENGFYIDFCLNTSKPKAKIEPAKEAQVQPKEAMGKFTTQVLLKRNRKKR